MRVGATLLFCCVQGIRSMIGERRVMQEALVYGFSLERPSPTVTCFARSTSSLI